MSRRPPRGTERQWLENYCQELITYRFDNHPYFSRAVRKDGSVDLDRFIERYRTFLERVPIGEPRKRHRKCLTPEEKRFLILRAGSEGYKTVKQAAQEAGMTKGYSRKEFLALWPLERNVDVMDSLYLEEFDAITAEGVQPTDFDINYINRVRYGLSERRVEAQKPETAASPTVSLPTNYVERLGLSNPTLNILKRAGINTVDELKGKSDIELLGLRLMGRKRLDETHQKLRDSDSEPSI